MYLPSPTYLYILIRPPPLLLACPLGKRNKQAGLEYGESSPNSGLCFSLESLLSCHIEPNKVLSRSCRTSKIWLRLELTHLCIANHYLISFSLHLPAFSYQSSWWRLPISTLDPQPGSPLVTPPPPITQAQGSGDTRAT